VQLEIGGTQITFTFSPSSKPAKSVSEMLRLVKANSSKWANEGKSQVRLAWQEGFSAFSVSESQVAAVR
jgi:hypothetical protein